MIEASLVVYQILNILILIFINVDIGMDVSSWMRVHWCNLVSVDWDGLWHLISDILHRLWLSDHMLR